MKKTNAKKSTEKKFSAKGLASKPIAKQTVTEVTADVLTGGAYGIVKRITNGIRNYRIARACEDAVDNAIDNGLVSEETVKDLTVKALSVRKELTSVEDEEENEKEEA